MKAVSFNHLCNVVNWYGVSRKLHYAYKTTWIPKIVFNKIVKVNLFYYYPKKIIFRAVNVIHGKQTDFITQSMVNKVVNTAVVLDAIESGMGDVADKIIAAFVTMTNACLYVPIKTMQLVDKEMLQKLCDKIGFYCLRPIVGRVVYSTNKKVFGYAYDMISYNSMQCILFLQLNKGIHYLRYRGFNYISKSSVYPLLALSYISIFYYSYRRHK
jgi:hypothetical protein